MEKENGILHIRRNKWIQDDREKEEKLLKKKMTETESFVKDLSRVEKILISQYSSSLFYIINNRKMLKYSHSSYSISFSPTIMKEYSYRDIDTIFFLEMMKCMQIHSYIQITSECKIKEYKRSFKNSKSLQDFGTDIIQRFNLSSQRHFFYFLIIQSNIFIFDEVNEDNQRDKFQLLDILNKCVINLDFETKNLEDDSYCKGPYQYLYRFSSSNFFELYKLIKMAISETIFYKSLYINNGKFLFEDNQINNTKREDFIKYEFLSFGNNVNPYYCTKNQSVCILKNYDSVNNEGSDIFRKQEIHFYETFGNKCTFIPKYYGTLNDAEILVIEYINGQTLFNYIKASKYINQNEKIRLILQLLIGVEYFHFKEYVIGDINPLNILINSDNQLFLIDFETSLDTKLKVGNYLVKFGESRTFKHDIMCIGKVIYYIIMENEYREGFKDLKKEFPSNYKCLRKACIDCLSYSEDARPTITELFLNVFDCIESNFSLKNFVKKFRRFVRNAY